MSWSVNGIGEPKAVAEKIAKDIASYKCAEPEETVRAFVGKAIETALEAYPEGYAVKVEACGSQTTVGEGKASNSLTVKIEPLAGFCK